MRVPTLARQIDDKIANLVHPQTISAIWRLTAMIVSMAFDDDELAIWSATRDAACGTIDDN